MSTTRDRLILPRAVLFDMDGTLTEPLLDFPRIKAEMGIGPRPILESIARMSPAEQVAARRILERHEDEAARHSTLNPGCRELLEWISRRGLRTALVTRNSRQSMQTVLSRHGLRLDVLIAREDAAPKPSPEGLLLACNRLEVGADQVWMVGDGHHDIEAAVAAGIHCVWLTHGRQREFQAIPSREARNLADLLTMLRYCVSDL